MLLGLDRGLRSATGRAAAGIVALAMLMLAGNCAWSDELIDDSVRARLERIREQLIEKGSVVHAH